MNRHDLSRFIIELNNSAAQYPTLKFQESFVQQLRQVTSFDAAWWGWAIVRNGQATIIHSMQSGLDDRFIVEATAQMETDPLFLNGRKLQMYSNAKTRNQINDNLSTHELMLRYDIGAVLAGHCQVDHGPFLFFMSLYRKDETNGFDKIEVGDFRLLIRHLQQSIALSLKLNLAKATRESSFWALVDHLGEVFFCSDLSAARSLKPVFKDLGSEPIVILDDQRALKVDSWSDELYLVTETRSPARPKLTIRERQVLQLYLNGMTMREVADALGSSANTVRNQISHVYRKTGVNSKFKLLSLIKSE